MKGFQHSYSKNQKSLEVSISTYFSLASAVIMLLQWYLFQLHS